METNLLKKKILVTGASSGIGRATAILLSQVGAKVVLVGRNEQRLDETISKMENPSDHFYLVKELNDLESAKTVIPESVENDNMKLDGIVYAAGVAPTIPLKMINYSNLDEIMRVNFYAFLEIVKNFSKKKYSNEKTSIVGISSAAAIGGQKCQTIYAASKAAMDAATITLSKELADKGIRMNTVAPSFIRTPMANEWAKMKGLDSIQELELQQRSGLGDPEDVANLAIFLLSSASKFITGQRIILNGGGEIYNSERRNRD